MPDDFKTRITALRFTQSDFAKYFCYDKGLVSKWSNGQKVPKYTLRTVELLEQGKIQNPNDKTGD